MDFKREQKFLQNTITTLPQFLMWFGNWSAGGDELRVHEEDEERIFLAYDRTGYLVAEFSQKNGLKTYK